MPAGRANDVRRDHGWSLRSGAMGDDAGGLFVSMLAVSSQGVLPRDGAKDVGAEFLAGDESIGQPLNFRGIFS